MAHISDRKYAEEMGLDLEQVRKMIRRLDIPFLSSGKGDNMVYMFDTDDLNEKLTASKKSRKDRKRGPRKKTRNKGKK